MEENGARVTEPFPRPDLISTGGLAATTSSRSLHFISPLVGMYPSGRAPRFKHSAARAFKFMNAFFTRLIFWFTTKRLCMWCEPHHWLGGNPLARQHTGGMCPKAQRKMEQEAEEFNKETRKPC
jgi:hypothetical protein